MSQDTSSAVYFCQAVCQNVTPLWAIHIVHLDAFAYALRLNASIWGIAIILLPLCQPYAILGQLLDAGSRRLRYLVKRIS